MNIFSKNKDLRFLEYINKKSYLKRFIQFFLGCFIIALAYNIFIASNNLVPGGVGGIAIILNRFFNINNSLSILIMNLILILISYFLLGKEKTRASILGTDIINQIISKYCKITLGKSMLFSDGLIVLSSGLFFGINSMMYSIIILYIISLISDRVVLGISDSKIFYIITDREEEIKNFIIKYLNHGVTVFKAKGGYSKTKENVLMAVLPTKDYYRLKEGIKQIDKEAFFIVTDTYEVFGGE